MTSNDPTVTIVTTAAEYALKSVMWEKGNFWIIDTVEKNGRTTINDMTLEEVRKEKGKKEIVILTPEEWEIEISKLQNSQYLEPKAEIIEEERWWDMLNCMPPSKWHHASGIEFFHVCERMIGDIVSWYGCCDDEYKHFYGLSTMSDEDLVNKFIGQDH